MNFTKYVGESSAFLLELVRLEHERERMKLEKLTQAERAAASDFLTFLQSNLPIPQSNEWIQEQWARASRSPLFAQNALKWQKGELRFAQLKVPVPDQTPAEMVEELAGLSAPKPPTAPSAQQRSQAREDHLTALERLKAKV